MRTITRVVMTAFALVAAISASPAAAKPLLDCPLRDTPFSLASPLIDIMLSARARAVVGKELGPALDHAPQRFAGTTAPTFAAILTLREIGAMFGASSDALDRADRELRKLKVTRDDKIARCARYDNDRIAIPRDMGKGPRLLMFEKINGFKDAPGFNAAHALFVDLARRNGWSIVTTDKGGAIRDETLKHFDAVIWNNISGDVLTLSQRRALRKFIERGGGFVAVHGSAGDPVYFWDWYADRLIGARFEGHPMSPQFQDARIKLETPASPLAQGLPAEWTMNDEWYSFSTNPRTAGATVLAVLDESTYSPKGMRGQDLHMGDHPIAWSNCVGKGRMFYSAIGHRPEIYSTVEYRTMLENAVKWVAQAGRRTGKRPSDSCCRSNEPRGSGAC